MDSSPLPASRSDRQLGSLSSSIARIFGKARSKGQLTSQAGLEARIEEPESADAHPKHTDELPLRRRAQTSDGRSLARRRVSSRVLLLSPARESTNDLQTSKEPIQLSDINLEDIFVQRSLLKAKSLLETSERQNLAFKSHSLPNDGVILPQQPLLPLNQQYPSLADFRILKTIGNDKTTL